MTLPDGTVCVLLVHAATATPPSNVARIVPSMSILPLCGCRLDPSDAAVVGPPAGGRKIAMLGDTCGSPAIAAAAAGAHLLIHEVRTLRVAAGWGGTWLMTRACLVFSSSARTQKLRKTRRRMRRCVPSCPGCEPGCGPACGHTSSCTSCVCARLKQRQFAMAIPRHRWQDGLPMISVRRFWRSTTFRHATRAMHPRRVLL